MSVKYNCDIILLFNNILIVVRVFSDIMMLHMCLNNIIM